MDRLGRVKMREQIAQKSCGAQGQLKRNPDDRFGLAFLLHLSVSLIAAAAIVLACNVAIARQRAKRRHDSRRPVTGVAHHSSLATIQ